MNCRRSAGSTDEPVYRWVGRGQPEYRRMTDADRAALDASSPGTATGRAHGLRIALAKTDWDDETDVLVAGSGAGGVTGAYTAAREGLDVILVEATDKFGGTTAYSGGGGMWFPCNPVLQRAGTDDTIEDALEYYTAVVGDRTPRALQETYVRGGAPLIEYLEADELLKFAAAAVARLLRQGAQGARRRHAPHRGQGRSRWPPRRTCAS